jgi:hypothetical protein
MPVLLQYAIGDGPITLFEPWKRPVKETLSLIESFLQHEIVGFNLTFDAFQLVKLYTIFSLCPPDWIPEDHIDEIAELEKDGRDGPCIKPQSVLDLMLYCRKNEWQSLMDRDDIRVKRVPSCIAAELAEELEARLDIDPIYFAKQRSPKKWKVFPHKRGGKVDPDFSDVVLIFHPAMGLKHLAEHVLRLSPAAHFEDIEPAARPIELPYAPLAIAVSSKERGWAVEKEGKIVGHAWPAVIKSHIDHWHQVAPAREYAEKDIYYTRALDAHFRHPTTGDDDSTLAWQVAVSRWRGFKIDREGLSRLLADSINVVKSSPANPDNPGQIRTYLLQYMDELEAVSLADTTNKARLESIAKWTVDEEEACTRCSGADTACLRCGGAGKVAPGRHPAALAVERILQVKQAAAEVKTLRKLVKLDRLHPDFNVVGTLSSRMSGTGGLSAHSIKHTDAVRRLFPLAWDGGALSIGDFSAYEVTIADAHYGDPQLRQDLLSGRKVHAIFGAAMFGVTYEQVMDSRGSDNDMYAKGKQGWFATALYGGDYRTLMRKLGVSEEQATAACQLIAERYPVIKEKQAKLRERFCSMQQGVSGGPETWREPAEYVESFLGHRRYFRLENHIARTMFELASRSPKEWTRFQGTVTRVRGKPQTVCGATASALYGAAFTVQASNMRAAANHEIQSPGAQLVKNIQRRVWDAIQPAGVHPLRVSLMNVHDELIAVSSPDAVEDVAQVILGTVEELREKVPLLAIDWRKNVRSWGEKNV